MTLKLNEAQETALREILAASENFMMRQYLLTGYAGTGKTTLMQAVARALQERKKRVILTAPTHKAVAVLTGKVRAAGPEVATGTIHSLLGLQPTPDGRGGEILKRSGRASGHMYDAVVIDECSMISSDLMGYIENDLQDHFVLFVGDKAQLPPVGETESPSFRIPHSSNLATVVRQEASNPILAAATVIREAQAEGRARWDWCRPAEAPPKGVYLAGDDAEAWMQDAFTSEEFAADNDTFRYLCWTNDKVARINRLVRGWIYGETPTPFVPGERVLCRKPILKPGTIDVAFSTNEEAIVETIEVGRQTFQFGSHPVDGKHQALDEWSAELPVWRVRLRRIGTDAGDPATPCIIPVHAAAAKAIDDRLIAEARRNKARWWDRFEHVKQIADLRSVYAMTVHTSQGSTFRNAFVDLPDIRKREISNPVEMLQLLYVAATRPTHALIVVGS